MLKKLAKGELNEILEIVTKGTDNSFEYKQGKITDILISAPHSANQTREGKIKYAERYTGVIANILHKYFGYSILYKTKNCGDDANYDEKSSYKDFLYEKCRQFKPLVVLDLHGLSKNREAQVNIGTNFGESVFQDNEIITCLIDCLKKYKVTNIVTDHPFSANLRTITSSLSRNVGTKAIQLELNYGFLSASEKNILKIVNAIDEFCNILRRQSSIRDKSIDTTKLKEIDHVFYNSQGESDFLSIDNASSVVLSAPHAKAGVVNNKLKMSESMSGSLCKILNDEFKFSVIYKSRDNELDYMNSKSNAYKDALKQMLKNNKVKLLLELHIINATRSDDMLLFLPKKYDQYAFYQIINILNRQGIKKFSINSIFDSSKKERVTNQFKGKCFVMQLCINQRLVENDDGLKMVLKTLQHITSIFVY